MSRSEFEHLTEIRIMEIELMIAIMLSNRKALKTLHHGAFVLLNFSDFFLKYLLLWVFLWVILRLQKERSPTEICSEVGLAIGSENGSVFTRSFVPKFILLDVVKTPIFAFFHPCLDY